MKQTFTPKRLVEIDAVNAAAENPAALIEQDERSYQSRLDAAADQILARGTRIIMLTGPSSSGKTTSCQRLAQTLDARGTPAQVISLDNFFVGAEFYPILPNGKKDYESPATLDMPELHRCLRQLYETGWADLPIYDFARERRAGQRQRVELNGGVCIMEGLHALNPILTEIMPDDCVFYIFAGLREEYARAGQRVISTREIRLCRRVLRDVATRGHSPEKTLSMWQGVLDGENQYVKPFKNRADFILDTSHRYEMGIIADLVDNALDMTAPESAYYPQMEQAAACFAGVKPLPARLVPPNSMLREFYGAYENA